MKRKHLLFAAVLGLATLTAAGASAAIIDWTDWTSATTGNPGSASGTTVVNGVGVSYTGQVIGTTNIVGTYPSYTPASTYADGVTVQNAPSPHDIIGLTGGNTNINTITFSTPVVDPVMSIWSLGQGGVQASFVFSDPFTIVAGGPSAEYGGSTITSVGDTVFGREGNGTIVFSGTFSSLSWTNPQYEYWYGFDVGVTGVSENNGNGASVPEPSTLLLLGTGMAGLGITGLRKFRKNA